MFYDRDGIEVDLPRYTFLKQYDDYTIVARDTVKNIEVSTVWLGLNCNHLCGVPMFFETMTFTDDPVWANRCWRYGSEKAALAGHQQTIAAILAGLSP
jgi:hypothetical protein